MVLQLRALPSNPPTSFHRIITKGVNKSSRSVCARTARLVFHTRTRSITKTCCLRCRTAFQKQLRAAQDRCHNEPSVICPRRRHSNGERKVNASKSLEERRLSRCLTSGRQQNKKEERKSFSLGCCHGRPVSSVKRISHSGDDL